MHFFVNLFVSCCFLIFPFLFLTSDSWHEYVMDEVSSEFRTYEPSPLQPLIFPPVDSLLTVAQLKSILALRLKRSLEWI